MNTLSEILKLAMKYLIEGVIVGIVAFIISKKRLNIEEVVVIGLTAASVFALLDIFLASADGGNKVADAARTGLGFATGSSLIGGIPLML